MAKTKVTNSPDTQTIDEAAIKALRDEIANLGNLHGSAGAVVDGVNSAKVRAFMLVMDASRKGVIYDGQAGMVAADWAASTGEVLSDQSMATAKSSANVWIKAGKSNAGCAQTLDTMFALARADRKKATRFWQKCTTALRQTLKGNAPLTEHECNVILTGASESESDALADLVAALKRVVTGYASACEAYPDDALLKQLHNDAIIRHEAAKIKLDARKLAKREGELNQASKPATPSPAPIAPTTAPIAPINPPDAKPVEPPAPAAQPTDDFSIEALTAGFVTTAA